MAQVNWSDPQVFWLNLTNAVLALVVIVCCVVVAVSIVRELAERRRRRARVITNLDQELRDLVDSYEVGITMTDGGEPIEARRKSADA